MRKKVLLTIAFLVAVSLGVVGMSAFEAHIINVTATIENALSVDTTPIDFGTVFPQEELDYEISLALSDSFQGEDRVDDVEYVIRQKPKCIRKSEAPIELDPYGLVTEDNDVFVCADPVNYELLPVLCPFLSKHDADPEDNNDDPGIDAFHGPVTGWDMDDTLDTEINGYLSKLDQDIEDLWNIDFKVPCFEDHCAQDWADFVLGINDAVDPDDYVLPFDQEHELFGCDLWIEVGHISLPDEEPGVCGDGQLDPGEQCDDGNVDNGDGCDEFCMTENLGCSEKADVMLVLDESGSIDSGELTLLATSAKAFVDAMAPSADGVHIGEVSFATVADLDVHLTDDGNAVKAAIDALGSGGFTNLEDALLDAQAELGGGDGHDRTDSESPDFMVIITDGNPTAANGPGDESDRAAAEAVIVRAAGTTIYVLGVGDDVDATYLEDEISSGSGYYYSAANFGALEALLASLAECNGN